MRSDFEPVYLKEANEKLERDLISLKRDQKEDKHSENVSVQTSLWEKFVGILKKFYK
ncbi:hypothetical protein MN086_04395 [Sulfurovum sp. XGS-02]|uniref:hypothetical protein n=1 Tax=Sulfurovum sp. XGS-02 TaxID=2925411 RepID=UPI00205C08FB|nr:hypothetical protein [Sulfurovum sp. XGS-02]UPT78390.1 hypothetical protein MN086_04395 [Sulfurovum sp. XGS-02]